MKQMPSLFSDWCAVTGADPRCLDELTLERFAHMAQPSRAVLEQLRSSSHDQPSPRAAAWSTPLRGNGHALARVLRTGTASIQDAGDDWQHRVRLRRLLALAVLIAPHEAGGAALTRTEITELVPPRLHALREQIGVHNDPTSCPRCVVFSWLRVIGTNRHWSRAAVIEAETFPDRLKPGEHRHELADPEPDWQLWPDEPSLLPRLDRWGYLELHASLHPSSISVLIEQISALADLPVVEHVSEGQVVRHDPPTPRISAEREREILAEADALNARMARIFSSLS